MKIYSLFLAMLAASTSTAVAIEGATALGASPNLNDDLKQTVFGELWERPELSKRDRSLVSVTAAIAQGSSSTLPFQFKLALDNGVTPQELAGTLSHLVYYSGLSKAIDAEPVLTKVFTEQGIDITRLKVAQAQPVQDEAAAKAQRETVNKMVGGISPGLAHFSNTTLNADVWLRNDLAARDRSLITISALITQGNVEQLPVHVRKGMANGLTRTEIGEIITQLAFYAGWPSAFSAATVIKAMDLPE